MPPRRPLKHSALEARGGCAERDASLAHVALSRRAFLGGSALLGGAACIGGPTLGSLVQHRAWTQEERGFEPGAGYGALVAALDGEGREILALPDGFAYTSFSRTGDPLEGGGVVPEMHDGMGSFPGPGGTVRLIRNHELRNDADERKPFGLEVPEALRYDRLAQGGCFTLDFDPVRRRLVRQFASLGGTLTNCAGGWGWRGRGWISCEETLNGVEQGFERNHGYAFWVPAEASAPVRAEPLRALGRFVHEAARADADGRIYETEDANDRSGFYRFTPDRPEVLQSGRLQMLGITGEPEAELFRSLETGTRLPVRWIDVPDPDPDLEGGAESCFEQARARGGAAFNRLEGIFAGPDGRSVYFASTSGGAGYGQLWHYRPGPDEARGELELVFESPRGSVLDSPDNICVSPKGTILCCEDDASRIDLDRHPLGGARFNVNRLIGIAPGGAPFELALNLLNGTEFAGCCFSPDGSLLFANIQGSSRAGSGLTLAIWGPWERGPL